MIQIHGALIQERRKENLVERLARSGLVSKALWTVQDLAQFAQLSPSKIYRDAEAGLIPCRRWGREGRGKKLVLRFYPNEILAWLDAGCPAPSASKALVESPKAAKMLVRKGVGQGAIHETLP
jgi:hypothetical protein